MKNLSILIVGGGISGQCLAIGLKERGHQVDMVELQKKYDVYGVGIIQQANALRALDFFGIADETMKRGYPYGLVKLCLPFGKEIGEAGTPPIGRFPSHNGISRRILHEILNEKAVAVGTNILMDTTIQELNQMENGVDVLLTNGTKKHYDLVIGADGVNSKVRKMTFGDFKPEYVGLSVWRYSFPRPKALETGMIFFGQKSKVGLIPMTEETMYMFVVSTEGEDPSLKEEQLVPMLQNYLREYPIELIQSLIPQITDAKLVNYRPLETLKIPGNWHKGDIIILGDAAHATIPQLGSGAALAIEDAVVLTEEIENSSTVQEAFKRFMERRLGRCNMVVEASETLGKWELMQFKGEELPADANPGKLMGMTAGALTAPI